MSGLSPGGYGFGGVGSFVVQMFPVSSPRGKTILSRATAGRVMPELLKGIMERRAPRIATRWRVSGGGGTGAVGEDF